jgi:ABC-2 type transport system permease protein
VTAADRAPDRPLPGARATASSLGPLAAAWIIARNDMRRRLRDRTAILTGVVAPLVLAGLIGFALGGVSSFSARIAIVDADRSPLSTGVVDGLVGGIPADSPLRVERRDDETAARAALEAEEVDAVLVLPAGFGASVTGAAPGSTPLPIGVVTDAGKRIAGEVARSLADGIAGRLDAARLGVATALAAPPPPGEPADPAARVPALAAAAADLGPVISVSMQEAGGTYRPIAYFGAAMAILFLFFTVGAGARSLLAEQTDGTLARVRAAPLSMGAVLLGKTASSLVLGLGSLLTVWLVTATVFRATWGNPAVVLVVIVATVAAVAGIGSLITALARTNAQADAFTSLATFVLALLGGSFQPVGSLPGLFARLALLTPNGLALRAFTELGAADGGLVDVLPQVGALVALAAVTLGIGTLLIRRRVLA